jgi:hypothetical protein
MLFCYFYFLAFDIAIDRRVYWMDEEGKGRKNKPARPPSGKGWELPQ